MKAQNATIRNADYTGKESLSCTRVVIARLLACVKKPGDHARDSRSLAHCMSSSYLGW